MEYVNFVIVKVKKFMSVIGEDKNEMNLNIEYGINPTHLTEAEIKWFSGICNDCIEATGIKILIECADHEKLKGKSKEALGIFYTNNIENPLDGDCKITIDNFFIHECYEEVFNNGFKSSGSTVNTSVTLYSVSFNLGSTIVIISFFSISDNLANILS